MQRFQYSSLVQWKTSSVKPLILMGARQVGKTHILKLFASQEFEQHHYINFEENPQFKSAFEKSLSAQNIISQLELFLEKKIATQDLILFDEIQDCPKALTALKYFAENSDYKVIAAGSLLGVKLNSESFPVGKVEFEFMHPMTFLEFLQAANPFLFEKYQEAKLKDLEGILHNKLTEHFLKYLYIGGLPEVVQFYVNNQEKGLEGLQQARLIQQNILKSYLSDFAKHSGKVNALQLASLWSECARQLGQSQDGSIRRFKFQGALPGKKQFSQFENIFHWLEQASLIIKSHVIETSEAPLNIHIKNSLFKAYIFDIGILNAQLNIPAKTILEQTVGFYKGFIAENFIAQELHALSKPLFSWEKGQSEIEFLIESNNEILPIEVKSGSRTRAKSLSVYSDLYNPKNKIIFSLSEYKENSGLYKVPLYAIDKFLNRIGSPVYSGVIRSK